MITLKRHRTCDLAEVHRHHLLQTVLEWWRDAGAPPPLSALSPFVLPKALLPRTVVIEIETKPQRYRFRLAGTAAYEDFGCDVTGRYVDEMFAPAARDIILAGMERPTQSVAPHFVVHRYLTERGTELCMHLLILPLVDAQGDVARLLSVSETCSSAPNYSDVYRKARRSVSVSNAARVF